MEGPTVSSEKKKMKNLLLHIPGRRRTKKTGAKPQKKRVIGKKQKLPKGFPAHWGTQDFRHIVNFAWKRRPPEKHQNIPHLFCLLGHKQTLPITQKNLNPHSQNLWGGVKKKALEWQWFNASWGDWSKASPTESFKTEIGRESYG